MKYIILTTILLSLVFASGCTAIAYRDSEREIRMEKAYYNLSTSGVKDEAAIRAVRLNGGAGIGVDFTKSEVLMKHPFRQAGAAVVDAGLLYGLYMGIDSISSSSSDSRAVDVGGDGNTVIINTGDSNTISQDQSESHEENN